MGASVLESVSLASFPELNALISTRYYYILYDERD